jgi:outer membrane protein
LRKTLILVLILFIVPALNLVYGQTKIAYVDSDVIIKQLPEAQEVQKKLEDLQKQYLDTVNTKESDLKTKADDFKTQYADAQKQLEAGQLTPDQVKELESKLGEMQVEIQKQEQDLYDYKQQVQQTLVSTQSDLFKPVKDKIIKIIGDVAKELKYNLVLDKAGETLLYGDKEMDITFKVLDRLNK